MRKYRSWAVLLAVVAMIVAACSGDDGGGTGVLDGNRLDAIKDRGELVVGMTLQFEPQMYR